jgi:hypothetical protein
MKKKLCFLVCLVAAAALSLIFSSCSFRVGREIPAIEVKSHSPLITITSWRVVGPFKLPPEEQTYTLANEEAALNRDFLIGMGGSETPFKLEAPTTNLKVDFDRDMWSSPPPGFVKNPFQCPFYDQIIDFPTPQVDSYVVFGYHSEFFKMMYAITNLKAENDTETSIIVSANSPVKLWLNGTLVAVPPPGSVGNTREIQHLTSVRLKKGDNFLVAKMLCFPLRNEFSVRIAGREAALAFVKEKSGIRDLLEKIRQRKPAASLRFLMLITRW